MSDLTVPAATFAHLAERFAAYLAETGTAARFAQQPGTPDAFAAFGRWLHEESLATPSASVAPDARDREIARLLRRLEKRGHIASKRVLRALPVSTYDEFALLTVIRELGAPSKNEAYAAAILETTTGAQILRRLAASGFVAEVPDPEDGRVRRVSITPQGERAWRGVFDALGSSVTYKLGDLSEDQRDVLLGVLRQMDAYHATHAAR